MVEVADIDSTEVARILSLEEDHFCDLKAIEIAPSKLTRTLSAFANAAGGDLYIGIDEDTSRRARKWRGFPDPGSGGRERSHTGVRESDWA
jgi:ATP-dependent DNA helicase RecG